MADRCIESDHTAIRCPRRVSASNSLSRMTLELRDQLDLRSRRLGNQRSGPVNGGFASQKGIGSSHNILMQWCDGWQQLIWRQFIAIVPAIDQTNDTLNVCHKCFVSFCHLTLFLTDSDFDAIRFLTFVKFHCSYYKVQGSTWKMVMKNKMATFYKFLQMFI